MSGFGLIRSLPRVAVLSLCVLPLSLHADDASKRVKVDEMLTLNKVDALTQQMLTNVPERVRQSASQRNPYVQAASTPEQKKLTDDYLKQMGDIAAKGAQWSEVHPKLVDLYMQEFTEPELDGIIAFYKTPAGQALITKTQEVSGKTLQILQDTLNAMNPEFTATTKAYETNMRNTQPSGGAQKAPTLGPDTTPAKPSAAPSLKPRQ